jgi:hypothetical protein
MRRLATICVLLTLLGAAGCGGKTKTVTETGPSGQTRVLTVPDIKFAKTKFLLHSALAFGAFHRYIYKPFRAGTFHKGAPGRKKALVKAGVAGLFAYHELKVARRDALASDRLRPLALRIDALGARLRALASELKSGNLNPAALLAAGRSVDSLGADSSARGATIHDAPTPQLGG